MQLIIKAKDSASAELKAVDKAVNAVRGRIGNLTSTVFNIKTAFAALGAGLVARDFLKTADSFERYRTQLVTVAGSAEKAESAMQWITDFTAKTPYELDQVTAAFTKLSAYGVDPMDGKLRVLGDTAAAMGKTLDQAVEAFADAATGEFERLKEFGIRASQEGDKVTFRWMQNGQQMVREAQKTQEGISTALTDILSARFAGAMERYSSTWAGMMSNLKDQWTLFQKDVMDAGVFDFLKAGLSLVLAKINDLREKGKLKEWAEAAANSVIGAFERMLLGAAAFYDGAAPIIRNIKTLLGAAWDMFEKLPTWAQSVGVVGAFLGGKLFAVGGVAALALGELANEASKVVRAMRDGIITMQEWKQMTIEQRLEFAKMLDEAGEFNEAGGQVVRQKIAKPIADVAKALDMAGSATEKVKVLLQYMRQLRAEQAGASPASPGGGAGGGAGASTIETAGTEKTNKAAWEARNKALGEWNKAQLSIYDMEQQAADDQAKAEEEDAKQSLDRAKILADMKLRIRRQLATDLQGQFGIELAEMDARHQQEIERLRLLNATKAEIEDAYRAQKLEKETILADQERRLQEARLELASNVAGGMADAFTRLYEATGKKQKEFFYLAKAAAIAQAVINIAQGVT
ncbi:MAG: hypothetical protein KKA45_01400, partial [Alphaproteobacteria bacterium]|nr:hypothetical protein [Alphaproteobacteria bacterium]